MADQDIQDEALLPESGEKRSESSATVEAEFQDLSASFSQPQPSNEATVVEPSQSDMLTQVLHEAVTDENLDPTQSTMPDIPDRIGVSIQDEIKSEPLEDSFRELFKAPADNGQVLPTKITDKPSVKLAKVKLKKLKAKKAKKGKKGKKGGTKKKRGKKKKKGAKRKKGSGKRKKKKTLKLYPTVHCPEYRKMATTPIGSDHGGGSGMGISVPGVMRVTLSSETQKLLGCVVGKDVTAESPWVFVDKSLIDDNMDLHSESSDFLPVRDDITDLKTQTVLLGYDALADADNQFYICVTETAQNAVVEILQQMQEDQQKWLQNALEKPTRGWKSLGSEQEVDLFTVKNSRPLMQMQVETTIGALRAPCNFGNRDADDVPDGYFQFSHRDDVPQHVSRLRIDKEVQVSLAKIDIEAQTEPGIPDNSWTQYEYSVDTEKPIEDEVVEQALAKFLQGIQNEICDALHYNELMDLHRDDYGRLVRYEEDVEVSQSVQYNEFMSFTDMKHCQGKIVSCAAFHPTCSGIVALAYVDHTKTELSEMQEDADEIVRNVYAMHPVLVWSFVDAFRPKLILDSPREVQALAFAPQNGNVLVGGLSNGQIAIWDLEGKIERVEQETRMTPDQVKYSAAMNTLMDWMKTTIRIEYLQPSAVSAIDGSHIDMVSQIVWLNPCWEINATGQFVRVMDDHQSLQAATASMDGSILFWNLDPLAANIPGVARRKWISKRPAGLKTEKSVFSNFHRKLKPVFRLEIQSLEERRLSLTMCMALYSQPVTYEEDLEFASQLSQAQRESMTSRFQFKPVHPPTEIHDLKNFIMVGGVNGSVLAIEWEGTEENLADYVNSKMCSSIMKDEHHSSPVFCLKRNPFIRDLYLSVGSKKFSLWSEKLGMCPLLWRFTEETYTDGAWSLQRPSMLQLVREDGTVEVWDFLTRSDTYILTQSVSGKTLTGIDAHTQYLPNNVVGIADYNGSYRLFFIPSQFQESDVASDIEHMDKLVDRERERRKAFTLWEAKWQEKNSAQAKLVREQKELENQKQSQLEEDEKNFYEEERRREEMELEQYQQSRKLIDQMKQKEPSKHIVKLAAAEQRWQETRRSHMVRMLLDKKKLEKADLEWRRGPFIQAQEAQHKKTLKLRQVLRQRSTIFRDTVKMHFFDIYPTTSQKPTQSEAFAAQLEDMDETFVKRYNEIEKLALEQLKPTSLEHTFNWKRAVQDGRSRRQILDTSLFHQTARVTRADERREYRRLHRNSEMQREDEKKRAKVRAKVGFIRSSASVLQGGSEIDIAGGDPGAQESSSELGISGNEE